MEHSQLKMQWLNDLSNNIYNMWLFVGCINDRFQTPPVLWRRPEIEHKESSAWVSAMLKAMGAW